jgi:hypothetical protein
MREQSAPSEKGRLPWAETTEKKRHEGILVLPTIAAMGLAAGGSNIAEVSVNSLNRLTIHLAEAVNTIARANGQSIEKSTELNRHREHLHGHLWWNLRSRLVRYGCGAAG